MAMKLLRAFQHRINGLKSWNPQSLRFRLTLGIATVFALGLGSVAIWLGWTMQRMLIQAHKDNILHLAERMPQDIAIYQEMYSQPEAMQKAVANVNWDNVFLWIKNEQGEVIAKSGNLEPVPVSPEGTNFSLSGVTVSEVDGRYWILCANSLSVNNETAGELYIAQDIHSQQVMLLQVMRNLGIATIVTTGGITLLSGIYISRSLLPLRRICQLTESISADQLGEAKIELKRAPTEVQQLAEQFDQMLMRLQTAWQQQRQFVSNVSHELRTPLTIVSGYLQSVQRRGDNLNSPQREALAMASSEADRTIQLLEDLLTLARVDNGQMQFQKEKVDLNEFVEQIVGIAEQYSDRAIDYQLASHSLMVEVDQNRLKQVLLNLIENAVKYSEPEQPITVKLNQKGEWGIIEVRDRGMGIPLAQQARIFERFYRVDEARARSTGGTGLGLSIVKTFVEGMGGTIGVSSQLEQGTTFTVSFPIVD